MHTHLTRWFRAAQWGTAGILLQATTCQSLSFDSDVFVSQSIATWYTNIAGFFIASTLTDLLDVSPASLF